MKRNIIIVILFLALLHVVFSFVLPSQEYKAEKIFHKIQKTQKKIRLNPDATPPEMVAGLERDLQRLIKKYPRTETAKIAYLMLAETYLTDKKYSEVVDILTIFLENFTEPTALMSKAHFFKGIALERQNRWGRAKKEFEVLKADYSNTPLGLQIPIYIAQRHLKAGDPLGAKEAFDEAVIFYQEIKEKEMGTAIGYMASIFMVETYLGLEKYTAAGEALEDTIRDYSTDLTFMQTIPYIDMIFLEKLNDTKKAKALYRYILDNAVDDRLKNAVKRKADALQSH